MLGLAQSTQPKIPYRLGGSRPEEIVELIAKIYTFYTPFWGCVAPLAVVILTQLKVSKDGTVENN
jgi:hypothetical protein